MKRGQRVLFRVLNNSATMSQRLALPGHTFQVVAFGNAVAVPASVPVLELASGERIDAVVEMIMPVVWILGEENAK